MQAKINIINISKYLAEPLKMSPHSDYSFEIELSYSTRYSITENATRWAHMTRGLHNLNWRMHRWKSFKSETITNERTM